jgi:hypothetical protein
MHYNLQPTFYYLLIFPFLIYSGDFDGNMDKNLPAGDFNGAGRDIEIMTRRPPATTAAAIPADKPLAYRPRDIEVFTLPNDVKPSTDFLTEKAPVTGR